ncbi:MAG: pentapeptide repeat-containing protein [Okeania sp. SIO3B3]|nr:pentapeptide repeat-containing protein [Okeania sp. SIO3B3]
MNQVSLADICLIGVNLSYANLFQCGFYDSDLTGADLTEAILESTSFTNANLTNANLKGAKGTEEDNEPTPVNLDDAIFHNTILPNGSICNNGCTQNSILETYYKSFLKD